MTIDQLLNRRIMNNGLIAIHKGRIIHESYRNGLSRELRHITMSTSKSFVGMLAQIAKQKGYFKDNDLASKYVPETSRESCMERRHRAPCVGYA